MCTVKERLRIERSAGTGDILEATAIFAGDANAVTCLVDEKIAFTVGTVAVNVVFLSEVAENEKDHVADMFVAVKIVSLVCFSDARKLSIIDHREKLAVRKLNGFQYSAFGADEENVDSGISAREGEKLSRHEKLS